MSTKLARQLGLKFSDTTELAISGIFLDKDSAEYPLVKVSVKLGSYTKTIKAVVMDRTVAPIVMPGLKETAQKLTDAGVFLADRGIVSDTVSTVGLVQYLATLC